MKHTILFMPTNRRCHGCVNLLDLQWTLLQIPVTLLLRLRLLK
jgi:hypothetical protein